MALIGSCHGMWGGQRQVFCPGSSGLQGTYVAPACASHDDDAVPKIWDAIINRNAEAVAWCIANEPKTLGWRNPFTHASLLHTACSRGGNDIIARLVEVDGRSLVLKRNYNCLTPLAECLLLGDIAVAGELLSLLTPVEVKESLQRYAPGVPLLVHPGWLDHLALRPDIVTFVLHCEKICGTILFNHSDLLARVTANVAAMKRANNCCISLYHNLRGIEDLLSPDDDEEYELVAMGVSGESARQRDRADIVPSPCGLEHRLSPAGGIGGRSVGNVTC